MHLNIIVLPQNWYIKLKYKVHTVVSLLSWFLVTVLIQMGSLLSQKHLLFIYFTYYTFPGHACLTEIYICHLLTLHSVGTLTLVRDNPKGRSSSHEHSTDGADGPVQDHSLGGGELPGKALWVHAGVPEHHGEGLQQDPLHQGWEWTVSSHCLRFSGSPVFFSLLRLYINLTFFISCGKHFSPLDLFVYMFEFWSQSTKSA